jgi:hypothetical protein
MGKEELLGTGQWECDGIDCGFTGTMEEVDRHINEQVIDFNDDLTKIRCWGSMEVGSQVWQDYHDRNIHPMVHIAVGLGAELSAKLQEKNK